MGDRLAPLWRSTCFSWLSSNSKAERCASFSAKISTRLSTTSLNFQVEAETLWGQRVAVCGSTPELGEWDIARSLVLSDEDYPVWRGSLEVGSEPITFSYLILYRDPQDGPPSFIAWEQVARRQLNPKISKRVVINHRMHDLQFGTIEAMVDSPAETSSAELMPAVRKQKSILLGNENNSAMRDKKKVTFLPSLIASLAKEEATPEIRRRRKRCVTFSRCVESPSGDDFHRKYKESKKVLGTGGMCGDVLLATRRSDSVEVAVKILPISGLSTTHGRRAMGEVRNHLAMNHPNICRLLEVFEEPCGLRLIMERLRGEDLYDHWSRKGIFTENQTVNYTKQITNAIAYCHSVGVCHRDLKLENACVEEDSHDARVKLIDFGLSVDVTIVPTLEDVVGTLYYMAPEVWKGQYNEKCDMWSLGILSYVMIDGGPPFEDDDDNVVKRMICTGVYHFDDNRWKLISSAARDFVSALLQVDAKKRMDAEQAANHPWLVYADEAARTTTIIQPAIAEAIELQDLLPRPCGLDCESNMTGRRLPAKYASNRVLSFGGMA